MTLHKLHSYINTTNFKNALFYFRSYGLKTTIKKIGDYFFFSYKYRNWFIKNKLSSNDYQAQSQQQFLYKPLISIIVPTYQTPKTFLKQMIDSVIQQTYYNWELCIADGSPDHSPIMEIVTNYQKKFHNIKIQYLETNHGISGNTNAALALASGEFIALLDHDDLLAPNALYEIVAALNSNNNIDVIYTDEDKVNLNLSSHYNPYFKPDFNLDLLRSCNYITHFYVARKSIVDLVGGFSLNCDGSQDYDFILRTSEIARKVYHIPKILYYWRIHPNSVAGDPASKLYAYDSAVKALNQHLLRYNQQAIVTKKPQYGYYDITYFVKDSPLVSIILHQCSDELKKNIHKKITYSNFEIVTSISEANGEYILFLVNIKQILSENNWIERLLANCQRKEIGISSGKIIYNKNRVYEAGLFYTKNGEIFSPFINLLENDPGYCNYACSQHFCSLVGPHCFMISKDLFKKFHKPLSQNICPESIYQLCFRLRSNNYFITILPDVKVELNKKTRNQTPLFFKYNKPVSYISKHPYDSFYNINFSSKKPYTLP